MAIHAKDTSTKISKLNMVMNKINVNEIAYKRIKFPILNIILGDYNVEGNDLLNIFTFKYTDVGDVQLLLIKLDESSHGDCIFNNRISTVRLPATNPLKYFNAILPELINKICINAKRRLYIQKGQVCINLLTKSADRINSYAEGIIKGLYSPLKKAFINGVHISLFGLYEEHFDINQKDSIDNLKYIEDLNTIYENNRNFINAIYLLSNYDNDEIYRNDYMQEMLRNISIYIDIKDFQFSLHNQNFSERFFVSIADYIAEQAMGKPMNLFCSMGVSKLRIPVDLIRHTIQYQTLLETKNVVKIPNDRFLYNMQINYETILNDIKSKVLKHPKNRNSKLLISNRFTDDLTNLGRIKCDFDLTAIRKMLSNEINRNYKNYIERKLSEIELLLYSFLVEEEINLVSFQSFVKDTLLDELILLFEENDKKYLQQKNEMLLWEKKARKFLISVFRKRIQIPIIGELYLKKWIRLFLEKEKYYFVSKIYKRIFYYFKIGNQKIENALNILESKIEKEKAEIAKSISALDDYSSLNTYEHYSSLAKKQLRKTYHRESKIVRRNEKIFENEALKATVENMFLRSQNIADEIFKIHVEPKNCFKEYAVRNNLSEEDAYVDFLNHIESKNIVNLRIIDSEQVFKKICICLPLDYPITENMKQIVELNFQKNIVFIRNEFVKDITIIHLNGNINTKSIYHF